MDWLRRYSELDARLPDPDERVAAIAGRIFRRADSATKAKMEAISMRRLARLRLGALGVLRPLRLGQTTRQEQMEGYVERGHDEDTGIEHSPHLGRSERI